MEPEAYVYALLLSKMPVIYIVCRIPSPRGLLAKAWINSLLRSIVITFVLTSGSKGLLQRIEFMEAKKITGYKNHIANLGTAKKYKGFRDILCQASMAYAAHHYLYKDDPRLPAFIQLMQHDVISRGHPSFLSISQFTKLTSSKTLTEIATDGIKKLKHVKPLNLDRIDQQLHSAGDAFKLLTDAIKSFTEEASRYNNDVHSGVDRGPAPTLALKAAAGIGKTMGIINNCIGIDALKGSIDYYVPSDVLGNQVIDDLKSNLLGIGKDPNQSPPFDSEAVTFRAIRGRSKADEDGNPLCLDIASVDKAKSLGMSIQKNICETCDHFTDCGYQKQFKHVELPKLDQPIIITEELIQIDDWDIPPAVNDDGTPVLVETLLDFEGIHEVAPVVNVLAHNYLFLQTPLYDKEQSSTRFSQNYCNLAVVDEKFWDKGIQTEEIKVSAIDNLKSDIASFVLAQLQAKKPLLKTLRAKYSPAEVGKAAAALLSTAAEFKAGSGAPKSKKVAQVLYSLRDEMIRSNRDDSRCVSIGPNKDSVECVHLAKRQPLTVPDDVPMIFIDADLSPEILKLYRPNVRVVEIPAKRLATVYQVTDITNSKSSLLDKEDTRRALSVVSFIKHMATTGKTLAVTIKDFRIALTGEDKDALSKCADYHGAKLAHFGSLRGLNDFEEYDNVVIIGRMEPPVNALERQANGMWWDDNKPISRVSLTINDDGTERGHFFEKLPKVIRYKGQHPHVIRTSCHPDPRAQVLLEQIREAETAQAIDRLRLVHKPKGPRSPRVFILSNIPVDIEVDQLFTLEKYSLIQQLVDESGDFIPLNKTHLTVHAKSIRTTSVAGNRIKEIKDNWDWYQSTGLLKGWHMFEYRKYRVGMWSKVITCLDHDDLKLKLQSLIQADVEIQPLRA